MVAVAVKSKAIRSATLYSPLPPHFRIDYFLIVVLWLASFYVLQNYDLGEFVSVLFLFSSVLTVVLVLGGKWSVTFQSLLSCRSERDVSSAKFIKIVPKSQHGEAVFCNIKLHKTSTGEYYGFIWRQREFLWNSNTKSFEKKQFPLNKKFSEYESEHGFKTENEYKQQLESYGSNRFEIPMPEFFDLYKEHMMAPFFIFQLFCVLLWCLDEYWYYSLFTLFMLLVFEGTVVKGRLKNLITLRNMVQPSREIKAYRYGKWIDTTTYDLVPGDIVSVVRPSDPSALLSCDLLLLQGSCVVNEAMLTGESTPQIKEPIPSDEETKKNRYDIKNDRIHTLYCGTKVVMTNNTGTNKPSGKNAPPEDSCIAYVLRTGFETSQGKLIRTILYSTERITANSKEAFLFILFLLVFAIAAAAYVLIEGLKNESRSRYKLMIECTLVLTSVVPPELPMELTLAVQSSLLALTNLGVYCTEPFRIPFAGKVDVCCFDKTGTLTSDELICKGIVIGDNDSIDPADAPIETQRVLAGCHSLIQIDGKTIGDPLELAALQAMGWNITQKMTSKKGEKVRIVARHYFSSALKRMSAIAAVHNENAFAMVKGAPEVIESLLQEVPAGYRTTYKHYTRLGFRVIALAYKDLHSSVTDSVAKMTRKEVESSLTFAGFAIFDCPLKKTSKPTLNLLKQSSHEIIMITGDNELTSCMVAKNLELITRDALILTQNDETSSLSWTSIDENENIPFDKNSTAKKLAAKYDLCVSGKTLQFVPSNEYVYIKVFARVSPDDKGNIISGLNGNGYLTLMCGDGTNDVGALKQAHIGVALLNTGTAAGVTESGEIEIPKVKTMMEQYNETKRKIEAARLEQQRLLQARRNNPAQSNQPNPVPMKRKTFGPPSIAEDEEVQMVQLGDASIASPFTAKGTSIGPIVHILRQGRCTLVTTLQMFMILALNGLINAYSLSALTLEGVKLGDYQATLCGMLLAVCFLFNSRSQPLASLSKKRPDSTVFTIKFFVSLLGQFAIHLYCIMNVHEMAKMNCDRGVVDLEAAFKPDLVNTAIFLMSTTMQVSTFAINYQGHPFMQSLRENKPLFYALSAVGGVVVVASLQIVPEFNEAIQLVHMAPEFQRMLILYLGLDFIGAYLFSRIVNLIF